jgi:hypothetical protein
MRRCAPIQHAPVAIERPRHARVLAEPARLRHLLERNAKLCEPRIAAPEPAVPAKIRQPRIDAHAGAGGDQQRIRCRDAACSLFQRVLVAIVALHA